MLQQKILHATTKIWQNSYDEPRQRIKKQRRYFANKGPSSQSYGFSCSHVWMWELNHKGGWMLKTWCFWAVVLEKVRVPWTARSNQLILKEINPEYSLEGLMQKLSSTLDTWWKNRLIRKGSDAGKDWQQEKGTTDDEMGGWHHWLNG